MYGVQSSKSFLVGHRHIEIIGSSKERNKISNNISDRTYKQGQIWSVRREDFHSFLNLWYGRHLRPGVTVSQIFGAENLKDVLPRRMRLMSLQMRRMRRNANPTTKQHSVIRVRRLSESSFSSVCTSFLTLITKLQSPSAWASVPDSGF